MSRAKAHHHNPQSCLRRFADQDGNLVVYDRIQEAIRQDKVKNVAVKSNLYTVYDANGDPSDMIETRWLSRIEDAFNRIVPQLLSSNPVLSMEERHHVCMFLTLQHLRTLHMRDSIANIVDAVLRLEITMRTQGLTPEEAFHALDEWNPHASEREKLRLKQVVAKPDQLAEWDATPWIKAIMRLLPTHTKRLEAREWHLIEAQDGAFLSSDRPVALGGSSPSAISEAPYLVYPLSPHRVLLLGSPDSAPTWRFGRNRRQGRGCLRRRKLRRYVIHPEPEHRGFVREVNQLVADSASREIFWHPATDPMADINRPVGTYELTLNGMPLAQGESYYDAIMRKLHLERNTDDVAVVVELGARVARN